MNKKMMLPIVFLVSSLFSTVLALNEEQREILYALNDLGQTFDSVPMIAENIDMFVGMLQMNMQITEKKLQVAHNEMNEQLWKSAKLAGIIILFQFFTAEVVLKVIKRSSIASNKDIMNPLIYLFSKLVCAPEVIGYTYSGTAIYDAFKAKNALEKALAVDRKILRKLEGLKDSLPQQPADQHNFAVKNVVDGAQ